MQATGPGSPDSRITKIRTPPWHAGTQPAFPPRHFHHKSPHETHHRNCSHPHAHNAYSYAHWCLHSGPTKGALYNDSSIGTRYTVVASPCSLRLLRLLFLFTSFRCLDLRILVVPLFGCTFAFLLIFQAATSSGNGHWLLL